MLIVPTCNLTTLMPALSADLRAAGLPESSGDGIPFAALALHQHIHVIARRDPENSPRAALLGLMLTLDIAECCESGVLPRAIVRNCALGLDLNASPLNIRLLGLLEPMTANLRPDALHGQVVNLVSAWSDTANTFDGLTTPMLTALSMLAIGFAHHVDPDAPISFDPQHLLYPTRREVN